MFFGYNFNLNLRPLGRLSNSSETSGAHHQQESERDVEGVGENHWFSVLHVRTEDEGRLRAE